MDIQDEWELVKIRYERSYKIKFQKRPSDETIHFLFEKIQQLGFELKDFYEKDRGLWNRYQQLIWNRYQQLKGLSEKQEDPVKKIKPWE